MLTCLTKEKAVLTGLLSTLIFCQLYLTPRLEQRRNLKALAPSLRNSSLGSTEMPASSIKCPSREDGSTQKSEYFLDLTGCGGSARRPVTPNTTKIILAWTLSYDGNRWFGLESEADYAKALNGSGCTFTLDKSVVSKADMVLFHSCFQHVNGFYYPKTRSDWQLYVYLITEAPTSRYCRNAFMPANGLINLTATYKVDSDVVFSYSPKLRTRSDGNNLLINRAENKSKLAFWYMSDCRNDWSSKRQQYVKELKKYMSVDVYGTCTSQFPDSKTGCPKSSDSAMDECFLLQSKKYKFYLAFENAICKDYITEKLFKILQPRSDVVPVVMGASVADYEMVAPRNSFIHVKNFTSPKALAEYLKYLGDNDEAYNAYHAWRSRLYYDPLQGKNSLDQHPPSQLQTLCRLAHDPPSPKVWDRLKEWYSIQNNCHIVQNVCTEYGICSP